MSHFFKKTNKESISIGTYPGTRSKHSISSSKLDIVGSLFDI